MNLVLYRWDYTQAMTLGYYLEQIMDIVGIQSSGQLINVWRYGLPLWIRNTSSHDV